MQDIFYTQVSEPLPIRDSSNKSLDETINQIMIDRGMQPQSKGVVHWSISSLTKNPRLADTLMKTVYKKQALVPASPWLDKEAPAAPAVTVSEQNGQHQISWSHSNEGDVFQWVLYYRYGNNWSYKILNNTDRNTALPTTTGAGNNQSKLNTVIVSAVDRTGNESAKTETIIK